MTVYYRSLSASDEQLDILQRWKDIHLQHIGTNVENPINEDDIIGDAKQIQVTNMLASGSEVHCIVEHICPLDFRGIADYRSLLIGFATLDNLRYWQDNHLHIIKYSVKSVKSTVLAGQPPTYDWVFCQI